MRSNYLGWCWLWQNELIWCLGEQSNISQFFYCIVKIISEIPRLVCCRMNAIPSQESHPKIIAQHGTGGFLASWPCVKINDGGMRRVCKRIFFWVANMGRIFFEWRIYGEYYVSGEYGANIDWAGDLQATAVAVSWLRRCVYCGRVSRVLCVVCVPLCLLS